MTSKPENKSDGRNALFHYVDQYLTALVAHDPSRLPLAKNVKFTENAQILELGEALWATASHGPTYTHYFADTKAGQAGFFGLLKENDVPVLMALRLKIEKKLITEIETIVTRPQPGGHSRFDLLTEPNPIFFEALSPSEHALPKEMIEITNLYFDAIEQDTGEFVPIDPLCNRIENGFQTTNNPGANSSLDPSANLLGMSCLDQLNKKMFYFITKITPRRYPLVDEERGLVLCIAMFVHAGNVLSVERPDVGKVETPPFARRPSSVMVAELFKIKNKKIREIEVIGTMLPYGSKTGWE